MTTPTRPTEAETRGNIMGILGRRTAPPCPPDAAGFNVRVRTAQVTAVAEATISVPAWPSGTVRFDGQTLELACGETRRIDLSNLREVTVKPPRRGRLSLDVRFQAGLGNEKTGVWIAEAHGAALQALVSSIHDAMPGA